MEGFDPRTSFGYDESKRYDAVDTRGDEEQTVAFLTQLAGQRDALEFAVGTGRIALPLVKAGVRVDGIELSQDMVDRMREKPDGNTVNVTMGDMSRVTTGRTYGLVYLVYNTIGNLLTQDDQVRCFQNAAHHLTDDGVFVLECRVPTAPSRPGHQYVDAEHIGVDHVVLDVCRYDPVTQILDENHVRIGTEGLIFSPIRLRLAHPPEFDLMARIAGLRLRERWGGWNGEPYTAISWRHVSVYERSHDRRQPPFKRSVAPAAVTTTSRLDAMSNEPLRKTFVRSRTAASAGRLLIMTMSRSWAVRSGRWRGRRLVRRKKYISASSPPLTDTEPLCSCRVASKLLAFCDMSTLYLRGVPEDVVERLKRLAEREGTSVNAVAVRELAESSRRADNPALLGALPDLGVDPTTIAADLDAERASS